MSMMFAVFVLRVGPVLFPIVALIVLVWCVLKIRTGGR
ncbi:hypothetical protein [Caudoviricetes sp.]|nr:hypothetical protein [Caudoviricetes sp.]